MPTFSAKAAAAYNGALARICRLWDCLCWYRIRHNRASHAIMVAPFVALVTIAWMWNPGHAPRFDVGDTEYYNFAQEISGQAPKGICYRVLGPTICRLANAASPVLAPLAGMKPLTEMNLDPGLMGGYAAAGVLALAGFAALGWVTGIFGLLLAWATIGPHGGVGDPITLGAFSVGVWAIYWRHKTAFWIAFVVASLNRETAPLMLLWYVMATKDWRGTLIGAAGWLVLRAALAEVFRGNELQMCWPMLERNLKMIGPLSLTTLAAYSALFVAVVCGSRKWPDWFRHGFVIGAVLLVVMAVLWSRPERGRVYWEILPMAALSARTQLSRWLGVY